MELDLSLLLGTGALLVVTRFATRNKCLTTSNKCLTSSNKCLPIRPVPKSFLLLVALGYGGSIRP